MVSEVSKDIEKQEQTKKIDDVDDLEKVKVKKPRKRARYWGFSEIF